MEVTNPTENVRKFGLDLDNSVIRSSMIEEHVFNFVWKIQDVPSQLNRYVHIVSPIFKDLKTGNEWRLELEEHKSVAGLCMYVKLLGYGSGEIIQVACETNILDSEMKTSLKNDKGASNAHKPQAGEDAISVIEFYRLCGKNPSYLSDEGALIIHVCLTTSHMHHNHKNFSGLSTRKCQVKILAQQLQNLWPNDKFSDVTLVTESGSKFPASKLILAANSPVFQAMFNSEMKEAKENEVRIPGFSDEVLKGFLEFVYITKSSDSCSGNDQTDDKCTLKENAAELLKFSEKYDVKHLKEECEKILIQNLTIENAADMLYLATFFNSPALKEKVVQFFKRYRKEVQNTESFQKMKVENPQVLIDFYSELN